MTTKPTRARPPKRRPKAPTTRPTATPDRPTPPETERRTDPDRVVLAAVAGAHGIAGEVRLKLFTDDLSPHVRLNGGAYTLVAVRPAPNGAVARLAEVTDRTAAEALRGTELWVARDMLPLLEQGEYYHADLIGLPVVSDTDEPLGTIVAIDNYGAGDVIEIERPTGKRFMVPMTEHAVPEWNADRLVVTAAFAAE